MSNLSFSGTYLMSRYVQFSRMKGCGLSGRSGFVAVAILVLLDFLLGYYVSQKVNAHFSPNKIIQEVLGALDHVVFYLR